MKIGRWFGHQALELTEADLLGSGSKRLCYAYPGNEKLCIKVGRPDLPWNMAQKQSFAEESYLSYLVRRDGRHPDMFPRAHGWVPTNFGPGLVMDKIQGADGQELMTLWQLLEVGQITAAEARELMDRLVSRAIGQRFLISDWNITNVILKGKSCAQPVVMVDGFGPKSIGIKGFIFSRVSTLACYKTRRSWERQNRKVEKSIQRLSNWKRK